MNKSYKMHRTPPQKKDKTLNRSLLLALFIMGGIIEATCVNNAHPPNKQTNKQTNKLDKIPLQTLSTFVYTMYQPQVQMIL